MHCSERILSKREGHLDMEKNSSLPFDEELTLCSYNKLDRFMFEHNRIPKRELKSMKEQINDIIGIY